MDRISYREFLDLLEASFPDVAAEIRAQGHSLPHLAAATFRQATERAMDAGQFWAVQQHSLFVEQVRNDATPDLANALDISYVEDLALGECTPQRYRAVKERMPSKMRAELASIHRNWR